MTRRLLVAVGVAALVAAGTAYAFTVVADDGTVDDAAAQAEAGDGGGAAGEVMGKVTGG